MPVEFVGLLVIVCMFILMFLRMPIAIAMSIPTLLGILYLRDYKALIGLVESIVWTHSYSYTLTTIPMFVLMGQLIYFSGISEELFTMFRKMLGRLKGALAIGTIGASGMFAAASGSSLATTGTLGVIASKEMLKAGYIRYTSGNSFTSGESDMPTAVASY